MKHHYYSMIYPGIGGVVEHVTVVLNGAQQNTHVLDNFGIQTISGGVAYITIYLTHNTIRRRMNIVSIGAGNTQGRSEFGLVINPGDVLEIYTYVADTNEVATFYLNMREIVEE